MKILFVLHFPPPIHGSSVVGQIIKSSTKINENFKCRYINLLVSRKVNETGKPSFFKVLRYVGILFSLLYEIIFKRPDMCYLALTVSDSAFFKDVLLVAILRFFQIPHTFHLHNKGVKLNENKKLYNILYRFVFREADVILLSKKLYFDIETFVPENKIYICPNGIEDSFPNFKPREIKNKNSVVKILFLSNLIVAKGVYVLLSACSILKKRGLNFECNFVGAEGDICIPKFKESIIEMGLSENVHYLGKKISDDKREIFEKSEIFAFPTYFECFGLVNLEAMQSYLPIVSTFEGGIPDIIEDGITGFLVPPKDDIAFADKLEILINDPKLRVEMGIAGRQKYEDEFNIDMFESNFTNILHQISQKK